MLAFKTVIIVLLFFLDENAGEELDPGKAPPVTKPGFKKTGPDAKRRKTICIEERYKKDTLEDYLYKHGCYPGEWKDFFELEAIRNEIITNISPKLDAHAKNNTIEPPMINMFEAFKMVSPDAIKVIILGQDPTPQAGKATGMAFSLKRGADPRAVPSVFNMLVELRLEGMNVSLENGDLTPWTKQGVLLLNSALTVNRGKAKSHQTIWKEFTKMLVNNISSKSSGKPSPSVWMLWGSEAQAFIGNINRTIHYVLEGGHPSPKGGRPNTFFGINHFHCANEFLVKWRGGGIDWQLKGKSGFKECPFIPPPPPPPPPTPPPTTPPKGKAPLV